MEYSILDDNDNDEQVRRSTICRVESNRVGLVEGTVELDSTFSVCFFHGAMVLYYQASFRHFIDLSSGLEGERRETGDARRKVES